MSKSKKPDKKLIHFMKQKECERKAQNIIVSHVLTEGAVDENRLLEELHWINQNHYEQINEERSIANYCGYSLCGNKIGIMPTKKYHISVAVNKVYDITKRKFFCSNQCYKANAFLKNQLYTSPLWMREKEPKVDLKLLKNCTELKGDEIEFYVPRIGKQNENSDSLNSEEEILSNKNDQDRSDSTLINSIKKNPRFQKEGPLNDNKGSGVQNDNTSINSVKSNSLFKKEVASNNNGESDIQCGDNTPINSIKNDSQIQHNNIDVSSSQTFNVDNEKSSKDVSSNSKNITAFSETNRTRKKPQKRNPLLAIENGLEEWITIDSLNYILGQETISCILKQNGHELETQSSGRAFDSSDNQEKYSQLCKRMNILDIDSDDECELPTKPLPDFHALKKETEQITIKVRNYFRGDKVAFSSSNKNSDDQKKEDDVPDPIIPISYHSTRAIQRNIVLDKLKIYLPRLCDSLDIHYNDVIDSIKKLIQTFKLSAKNITYNPIEWNLLGIMLLKLLSVNNESVKKSFIKKKIVIEYFLQSCDAEKTHFDLLTTRFTHVEFILKKKKMS